MIQLLEYAPNADDACSYYRGRWPLSRLVRSHADKINITLLQDEAEYIAWPMLSLGEVLFMLRPSSKSALELIKRAKAIGVKVWVDYDDNFLMEPGPISNALPFDWHDIPGRVRQICALSDAVSVSTNYLGKLFRDHADNVWVIENAFDEQFCGEPLPFRPPTGKWTLFSRAPQHDISTYAFKDALQQIGKTSHLHFMGHDPHYLPGNRAYTRPLANLRDYFRFIKSLNPPVFIKLLTDHPFNRSKSNISFIEATLAGAVLIAPDFEEYQSVPCLRYQKPEAIPGILDLLTNSHESAIIHEGARYFMQRNMALSDANEKRLSLLESLTSTPMNGINTPSPAFRSA